jgi:hypothetical protein
LRERDKMERGALKSRSRSIEEQEGQEALKSRRDKKH